MREKTLLMDSAAMNRAMLRISHEIIERNHGVENVVLIGIQRRGVPMAQAIAGNIGPVSYTHLNSAHQPGNAGAFRRSGGHGRTLEADPVSYTQLDVYKRQG